MDFNWFEFVLLPLFILLARVVDVSMDTVRVILVTKGYRKMAPIIGFVQALIWLVTITRIMVHLDNPLAYVGYAAGFGLGTYVGMMIEGKLALGYELIRVITKVGADELVLKLREKGYPVTSVPGYGRDGEVGVLFVIMKRKVNKDVISIINEFNPNAFYTIEDMRFVSSSSLLTPARKPFRFGLISR